MSQPVPQTRALDANGSPTAAPISLGIIGLSANAITSWASAAHLPPLLTPTGRSLYTVAALCNSSVAAAQDAIATYGLDASTVRAYGSPEDLATDKTVRAVICSTRVDKHCETILPSIRAGKDVYVEWPIASNAVQVEEILEAARSSGSRVAVGLQGRWAPPVRKLRELLNSGRVGKLLSCSVRGYGGAKDRGSVPEGLRYFLDKKVGGNPVVIGFAHMIDFVQSVVGEYLQGTTHAHMQIQRPEKGVRDSATGETKENVKTDVPDIVDVHGTLLESSTVAAGATLSAQFRTGQPFLGDAPLTWSLHCERGEIQLIARGGAMLQANAYNEPLTIKIHDFETDTVSDVEWDWSDEEKKVPVAGRGVLDCLYAFASSSRADGGLDQGFVGLEDAAKRARQIWSWMDFSTTV